MYTLIALHGNGGGGFRFSLAAPHFPETVDFRAPTLPGFANEPANPDLTSLKAYAQWLEEEVVQPAETPVVLLGHGIGGSVALEYAQHYADSICGLLLHAPVGADLEKRWFPRLMKLPGMRAFGKNLFSAQLMRPVFRKLLFEQPPPRAFEQRFFREYRQCSVFGDFFDYITAEWFNRLKPVELPALLVWGEKEKVLRVEQAQKFQQLLPNARIERIGGWDHFPMVDQPEHYARVIARLGQEIISHAHAPH